MTCKYNIKNEFIGQTFYDFIPSACQSGAMMMLLCRRDTSVCPVWNYYEEHFLQLYVCGHHADNSNICAFRYIF